MAGSESDPSDVESRVLSALDGPREARGAQLADLAARFPEHVALIDSIIAAVTRGAEPTSLLRPRGAAPVDDAHELRNVFAAGQSIGGYRLTRLIGKGGMGQVWEAIDLELGRPVALKLLLPDRITALSRDFFAREGRAGGRIMHPGVAIVYRAGTDDGVAFIAQELVAGGWTFADTIASLRAGNEVPDGYFREVAVFLAEVADALGAAHAAGVIHRDVKPQNLMVTPSGRAKVTDFGLARITSEPSISRIGDLAGTYAYMSPEQVTLKQIRLDPRSDVYSLGVVMYEALTLARPFAGDTTQQIVQKILFEDPIDPRRVRSQIPTDLAVIARRAIEKNPEHRFESMAEFAADLRRFLDGVPIHSRSAGVWLRSTKWVRRHPIASVVVAALCVMLVGLAIAVTVLAEARATTERSLVLARAEASRAAEFNDFVVQMFNFAMPEMQGFGERYSDLPVRVLVDRAARLADSWPGLTTGSGAMNHTLIGNLRVGIRDYEGARRHLDRAVALADRGGDAPQARLARGWAYLHLSRLAHRVSEDAMIEPHARRSIAEFDQLTVDGSRFGMYPRAWLSVHLFHRGRRQEAYDLMLDAFLAAKHYVVPTIDRPTLVGELEALVEQLRDDWFGGRREVAYQALVRYCDGYTAAVGYDPLIPMGIAAVAMYFDYYRGDKVRSEPLYRCCARLSRERLGETHPVTVMLVKLASEAIADPRSDQGLIEEFQAAARRAYGDAHPDSLIADLLAARQQLENGDYSTGKTAVLGALGRAASGLGADHESVIVARLELATSMPPFRRVRGLDDDARQSATRDCLVLTASQATLCWEQKPHERWIVGHAIAIHIAALMRTTANRVELETWVPRLIEARLAHGGPGAPAVVEARIWRWWTLDEADQRGRERAIEDADGEATACAARVPTDVTALREIVGALGNLAILHLRAGSSERGNRWLDEAERILRNAMRDPNWNCAPIVAELAEARLRAEQWDRAMAMFEEVPEQILELKPKRVEDVAFEVGRRLLVRGDARSGPLLEFSRSSGGDRAVRVDLAIAAHRLGSGEISVAAAGFDALHEELTTDGVSLTDLAESSLDALAGFATRLGRSDRCDLYRAAIDAKQTALAKRNAR